MPAEGAEDFGRHAHAAKPNKDRLWSLGDDSRPLRCRSRLLLLGMEGETEDDDEHGGQDPRLRGARVRLIIPCHPPPIEMSHGHCRAFCMLAYRSAAARFRSVTISCMSTSGSERGCHAYFRSAGCSHCGLSCITPRQQFRSPDCLKCKVMALLRLKI